jgi:hypothetical protein
MSVSAPLSLDQSREQVEGMMERGTAFSHVEDAIDTAQLSTRQKAALWLLAWSLRDNAQQRHEARLMVAALGGRGLVGE